MRKKVPNKNEFFLLSSSRIDFYFFSAAKKSKQKMPPLWQGEGLSLTKDLYCLYQKRPSFTHDSLSR